MKKVGVSKLVDFRRTKNEGPKLTIIKNLQKEKAIGKEDPAGGGGDYWITCTSASAAAFWHKDKAYLDHKIGELAEKIEVTKHKPTKDQFKKNIEILERMQDFDFDSIMPASELERESLKDNIIQIENLPVQVRPQHVFSYEIDGEARIGGVWFVAKKGGYSDEELAMFAKALHQYLAVRFADKFAVDPDYCVAIDTSSVKAINYSQIANGDVADVLPATLGDLGKFIK